MRYLFVRLLFLFCFITLIFSACARNVNFVKAHAAQRWEELGYTVIGYEGYQWSPLCGGDVWHSLKRQDTPGVIYSGHLCKWGNELQVYGPVVISGDITRLKNE